MSRSSRLRQQTFVDKSIQGGLITRIFLHWLTFFFVTALAVVAVKALLGDPNLALSERIWSELREFTYLGIVIITLFPAFMLDTVRFSNRFVGPVTRLRRHLRELGEDTESQDIKFRDNDFWQPIAGEFNTVNDLVKKQKLEIETLQAQLNKATTTSSS